MVTKAEIKAYVKEMPRDAEGASERPERWECLRKRLQRSVPPPQIIEMAGGGATAMLLSPAAPLTIRLSVAPGLLF
jgi:hypothetical protein